MKRKSRLFVLVGMLGLVTLAGTAGATIQTQPVETFCLCGCPDGTVICVASINGDCNVPCAQAAQYCPSNM